MENSPWVCQCPCWAAVYRPLLWWRTQTCTVPCSGLLTTDRPAECPTPTPVDSATGCCYCWEPGRRPASDGTSVPVGGGKVKKDEWKRTETGKKTREDDRKWRRKVWYSLTSVEEKVKVWECPEREWSEEYPTLLQLPTEEPTLWNQEHKSGLPTVHIHYSVSLYSLFWSLVLHAVDSPSWSSYLVSSACGGHVGQTAAGHRPEKYPASLFALLFLLPAFLSKPGKGQAGGHGGDRVWRRHSSVVSLQVPTRPTALIKNKKKKRYMSTVSWSIIS